MAAGNPRVDMTSMLRLSPVLSIVVTLLLTRRVGGTVDKRKC